MFNSIIFRAAFALLILTTLCECQETSSCTSGYENHPLILVSMDGFRYDYRPWGSTPRIDAFSLSGVSSPFMKASYPTKTFPNHYTIATGLYPESHGIVSNHFYDPVLDDYFDIGSEVSLESKWWGGDPIWNTVTIQGKKSATMFWPGSDAFVEDMHPTYWFPYDESYPFDDRVTQGLEWLALPEEDRPIIIVLYFEQPDSAGHGYGPFTPEVYDQLSIMDTVFGNLLDGIEAMNLTSCVNVMLVSDHGMAAVGEPGSVQIYDYVPDIIDRALVYEGVLVSLDVYDKEDISNLRQELTCNMPHTLQYEPADMPNRMHYSNNIRIGDIVLEMSLGYEGFAAPGYYVEAGSHGYDNYYPAMQPIFMASGPDFLVDVEVEPFQNIELYNLMCFLTDVEPSPTNGTLGTLYQVLLNPPEYPSNPEEAQPDTAQYPSTEAELELQLHISNCSGDLDSVEVWMTSLNLSDEEMNDANNLHLPWGTPQTGDIPTKVVLLYHQDHITGYSTALKMPAWVSFTLENIPLGTAVTEWSSDFRLNSSNTATCNSYQQQSSTMQPLFPNKYSLYPSLDPVPFLVSNAVPMTEQLRQKWELLFDEFVDPWIRSSGEPINLVLGPVFDHNSDSLPDDFPATIDDPAMPSHLFLMATRCQQTGVTDMALCLPENLDAIGFIFPEEDSIPNCMNSTQYRMQFSSKVKDIEIATGLLFNTELSYKDRIQLETRMPTSLWN